VMQLENSVCRGRKRDTSPAKRRWIALGSVQDKLHRGVENGMTAKPVAAGN
jgi:hypothetical protein